MTGERGSRICGTANLMMAATQAAGTTTIREAAGGPAIVELAELLTAMGARITGAGTTVIRVEGVTELHGVIYQIDPLWAAATDAPP